MTQQSVPTATAASSAAGIAPIEAKTDLMVGAVDSLLFQGPAMSMLRPLAGMMGMSQLSIGELLPQKNRANLRPFLASLNSTISAVLDDQVSFDEFIPRLATQIQEMQRIVAEEKQA